MKATSKKLLSDNRLAQNL